MQMYKGLPIITNKIPAGEQRGIPHHLLGQIDLDQETWVVGVFKREASRVMAEIRSRGKLPIVVGGTHYYTNRVLFEDNLVDPSSRLDMEGADGAPNPTEDSAVRHPILDGPTDAMLARLREVDPAMAGRWHPNDRRKIRRSLEIYLTTGRRASDIYAEQQRRREESKKDAAPGRDPGQQALMLWVHCDPAALGDRLDRRVGKMLDAGLLDETQEMFDYLRSHGDPPVDRTKGIWQSIGFKEFEPYLQARKDGTADPAQLERLKAVSAEDTKTATRRYARSQVRWLNLKTVPLVREAGAMGRLFVLDGTDPQRRRDEVVEKAADLTWRFLAGERLPEPAALSDAARDVLAATEAAVARNQSTPCNRHCELCQTTLLTEEGWAKHLKGNRHRRMVKHAKKTALVAVDDAKAETEEPQGSKVEPP